MSKKDYYDFWGFNKPGFDNFDEGEETPRWGFNRQGSAGYGKGSSSQFWEEAMRQGSQFGTWAFKQGWDKLGPSFWGSFEGFPGWNNCQRGNINDEIAMLERVEVFLNQHLSKVRSRLEELRAEKARQKDQNTRKSGSSSDASNY